VPHIQQLTWIVAHLLTTRINDVNKKQIVVTVYAVKYSDHALALNVYLSVINCFATAESHDTAFLQKKRSPTTAAEAAARAAKAQQKRAHLERHQQEVARQMVLQAAQVANVMDHQVGTLYELVRPVACRSCFLVLNLCHFISTPCCVVKTYAATS
jgi:hypothetical protein